MSDIFISYAPAFCHSVEVVAPPMEKVLCVCTGNISRSRWIGDLDLTQYRWIVCVGADEADRVRATPGADPARVLVANADQGGIPDPYELGLTGYRDCLALLDQVMPQIAVDITNGR